MPGHEYMPWPLPSKGDADRVAALSDRRINVNGKQMATPTQPPTASELLAHPAVVDGMAQAWADSQVSDPAQRHEEGWIYLDLTTGVIVTRRAPAGTQNRLSLANPPLLANHVVVGTFHTHPNPAAED
jgi:hypothetical protein